jgi:hypothetical protein
VVFPCFLFLKDLVEVNGVARGQLTPAEGQAFSAMLEGRRRVIETEDQDQRIRALEDRYPMRQPIEEANPGTER